MKQRIRYFCLTLLVMVAGLTSAQVVVDNPVAQIGEGENVKKFETLEAAFAAAEDDATIKVIKAGEYAIPAIPKNLTIEATVNGVVVNHTDNAAITTIASGKTATFKNITFNLGTTALATGHGFGTLNGSNGALVMDGCTIDGALNLFGASTLNNCTFNAEGIYNIWAVNDDATFTGCTFTNTNRAVNVYDQKNGTTKKNVSFSNCTFKATGTAKKKAAINIHHNPSHNSCAQYNVSIDNCSTTGDNWASTIEETGEPEPATICNSPLWMVSDIENGAAGDIAVTVNNVAQDLSKIGAVAKIGEEQYYSLAEAFEAAIDDQTITVLTDIDLPSTIAVTKKVTLDLDGKTISNTSDLWAQDKGIWSLFSVQVGGNLTVTGNGTIDAKENDCYSFDVRDGGILTIKNGTFTGNISCVYLINETGTGVSTCNIEGGTFSIKQLSNEYDTDKYRFLLNCYDASYRNNTVKFNVTGGSFVNFNPANNQAEGAATNFCAAGYEAVQDGNVWTVQKAPVAKIGETTYTSLADAVAAVPTDGTETTITMLANTSSDQITIPAEKNIVIDFAGFTVTPTNAWFITNKGSLTLNNTAEGTGGITSTYKGLVDNYGTLTVNGGTYSTTAEGATAIWNNDENSQITVNGGTVSSSTWGIVVVSKSKLTVKGDAVITGDDSAISGNGSEGQGGTTINIEGGTITGGSVGIYQPQSGNLNITGGTINGETGVYVKSGELSVTGGAINGTGEKADYNFNGNGANPTGDALVIDNCGYPGGAPAASVTGGTFTSSNASAIGSYATTGNTAIGNFVSGGYFNTELPDELCATGKKTVASTEKEGYYEIADKVYVAKIGETGYETLAAAVEAVPTDGTEKTITLLADVTENVAVSGGKNIVLDLGEKTLTGYIDLYDSELNVKNGNVAGTVYVNGGPASAKDGYNKFTLANNATITADYGIILYQAEGTTVGYGSTIDINGTVNGMVWVMGNITKGNSIINVNSGASIKGDVGVALNGLATVNVAANTTIEGAEVGIEARAGKLNVEGGKISSTATTYEVKANGSGTTTTGAAIAVAQHTTGLPINANILGGTLSGIKTISVADPEGKNMKDVTVMAADALANAKTVIVPEGYVWISDGAGMSTLSLAEDTELILIDGEPYPLKTTATFKKVTYRRTFAKSHMKKYQSWFIPFDYTITEDDVAKFDFYRISMIAGTERDGEVENNGAIYIYIVKLAAGYTLQANRAYMVKPHDTYGQCDFVVEDNPVLYAPVIEPNSRKHLETSEYSYDFYGNYATKSYKNAYEVYWMGDGSLRPNGENKSIGSYRWYIKRTGKESTDAKISFVFVEDNNETTKITNVETIDSDEIDGIYSSNGVKLNTPQRGMNIIRYKNGKTKKIIIK